jgi:hypothetical protein
MPDIDVTNRAMLTGFSTAEQRTLKRMLHRMRRSLASAADHAAKRRVQRTAKCASGSVARRR